MVPKLYGLEEAQLRRPRDDIITQFLDGSLPDSKHSHSLIFYALNLDHSGKNSRDFSALGFFLREQIITERKLLKHRVTKKARDDSNLRICEAALKEFPWFRHRTEDPNNRQFYCMLVLMDIVSGNMYAKEQQENQRCQEPHTTGQDSDRNENSGGKSIDHENFYNDTTFQKNLCSSTSSNSTERPAQDTLRCTMNEPAPSARMLPPDSQRIHLPAKPRKGSSTTGTGLRQAGNPEEDEDSIEVQSTSNPWADKGPQKQTVTSKGRPITETKRKAEQDLSTRKKSSKHAKTHDEEHEANKQTRRADSKERALEELARRATSAVADSESSKGGQSLPSHAKTSEPAERSIRSPVVDHSHDTKMQSVRTSVEASTPRAVSKQASMSDDQSPTVSPQPQASRRTGFPFGNGKTVILIVPVKDTSNCPNMSNCKFSQVPSWRTELDIEDIPWTKELLKSLEDAFLENVRGQNTEKDYRELQQNMVFVDGYQQTIVLRNDENLHSYFAAYEGRAVNKTYRLTLYQGLKSHRDVPSKEDVHAECGSVQ